jgi:hypothetical protein
MLSMPEKQALKNHNTGRVRTTTSPGKALGLNYTRPNYGPTTSKKISRLLI